MNTDVIAEAISRLLSRAARDGDPRDQELAERADLELDKVKSLLSNLRAVMTPPPK